MINFLTRLFLITFLLSITPVVSQDNIDINSISNNMTAEDLKNLYPDFSSGFNTTTISGELKEKINLSENGNSDIPRRKPNIDLEIDPENYTLGINDELTIYLRGNTEKKFITKIGLEGNILIPAVGHLHISGLKLDSAKIKITEKVLTKYKDIKIKILLSDLKVFKVYASGSIKNPGAFIVNGATRVSDLFEVAGKYKSSDICYRLRNIRIENPSHPTRYADIAQFYHSNILKKNPYLRSGDRVYFIQDGEMVLITGAVNNPGYYSFMKNDTLSEVILASGGLTANTDSSRILVTRFVDNFDSLTTFRLTYENTDNFILNKDDRILVSSKTDYRVHRMVSIKGEVKFPGIYPIRKDKTHLKEIIEKAGGLTEDAFLAGSNIVRENFGTPTDKEYQRLKFTPIEQLSPSERSYLKTKQIEKKGRISIDFEKLYMENKNLYDIVLRNGDLINISRKNRSIKVMGAVVSPGLVNYKESNSYKHYIRQAGGFNTMARKNKVIIIKGGTGIWLKPRKVEELEAGDAIFVPEKQYHNFFRILKDVITVMGSAAVIITVYITLSDRL